MNADVLFVCLGNICRSPAAEAIALRLKEEFPAIGRIDSAGIGNWHVGDPPDPRMIRAAAGFGLDLAPLRGRQVERSDFDEFDLIVGMDSENVADLKDLRPVRARAQVVPMSRWTGRDVPDPYTGGPEGFDRVLTMLFAGVRAMFEELSAAAEGKGEKR